MKRKEVIENTNVTFSPCSDAESRHEKYKMKNTGLCNTLKSINGFLIRLFHTIGYNVGAHPVYYIVIPFVISMVLSTGVLMIEYEENPMVLFVPFTAPFLREQKIVEEHFPMNYTDFYDPVRFTRHEGHSRVIITAKDGKSILRSNLWPEIMDLDARIRNISVVDSVDGIERNYEEMCAKWRGNCVENTALNLNQIIKEVENGSTIINYPIMVVPFIIPQLLGGPVINETAGKVDDAEALLLAYFLAIDTPHKIERAFEWEKYLLEFLRAVNYEGIKVSYFTSRSLSDELRAKMDSCLPYIPLTAFIMIASCTGLLCMSDCIRSKPLIGVVGIFSAGMAAGASFGFLIYCGASYTRLNVVALFLVLGIGVDDIFVAISAWQKTSLTDSVPKRLAQTYGDAAVSVTITSLTNALAFAVGTTTPTVIVQNFCMYCAVTIIFAYIWFITFCGGFLAIAGHMEKQGRHSIFFIKVKLPPANASEAKKKFYSLFCHSTLLKKDSNINAEVKPHIVSVFFRDVVGSLLMNKKFRVLVVFSFVAYLIGAIYGCCVLKEGLYRHRMSRDDSYLVNFSKEDNQYFRHLPYSIQIVITGNITYSDRQTQKELLNLEKKFESLPHSGPPVYTQSWLRGFMRRLRRKKELRQNITDEASFIRVLREEYFFNPDNPQILDVEFNDDYTRILASRTIFQAANVTDVYDDVIMMNNYRKVAAESKFNITIFHILFSLFDQHSMMKPLAIQSILIAVALVMVVALLFIPDAWGSIALSSSILSIAVGVIGYMAFWDINLDHVSSGSIFMCIGFSVDFSAHITYTYLSSKSKTSEGKIRDSMFSLGLPIIQGGLTTILSLVTFLLIPGYGYRTFFKTIFLVTIFAAYHSIILIPLFLALLEYLTNRIYGSSDSDETAKSTVEISSEIRPITNGNYKDPILSNGYMTKGTYIKKDTEFSVIRNAPDSEQVQNLKNLYLYSNGDSVGNKNIPHDESYSMTNTRISEDKKDYANLRQEDSSDLGTEEDSAIVLEEELDSHCNEDSTSHCKEYSAEYGKEDSPSYCKRDSKNETNALKGRLEGSLGNSKGSTCIHIIEGGIDNKAFEVDEKK